MIRPHYTVMRVNKQRLNLFIKSKSWIEKNCVIQYNFNNNEETFNFTSSNSDSTLR